MNNTGNKSEKIDREEILRILKEIEVNPNVTQRGLSERCSVSLGKINFLVNSLIDKGMLKARNFKNSNKKLAYTYLFTPYGVKTKIALTRQFLEWKLQEYARLEKEIEAYKNEIYQEK